MTHALTYRWFREAALLSAAAFALTAIALSGCTVARKVANVVQSDATTATALAKADTLNPNNAGVRAGCYQAIANMAAGLSAAQTLGVLSLTEASLQGQELAQSANCQAVAGAVLINLMQQQNALMSAPLVAGAALGPAAGLIP